MFVVVIWQFEAETFDAVLDKGGLDALMEPEVGPDLGDQYLSEVLWTSLLAYFAITFVPMPKNLVQLTSVE